MFATGTGEHEPLELAARLGPHEDRPLRAVRDRDRHLRRDPVFVLVRGTFAIAIAIAIAITRPVADVAGIGHAAERENRGKKLGKAMGALVFQHGSTSHMATLVPIRREPR